MITLIYKSSKRPNYQIALTVTCCKCQHTFRETHLGELKFITITLCSVEKSCEALWGNLRTGTMGWWQKTRVWLVHTHSLRVAQSQSGNLDDFNWFNKFLLSKWNERFFETPMGEVTVASGQAGSHRLPAFFIAWMWQQTEYFIIEVIGLNIDLQCTTIHSALLIKDPCLSKRFRMWVWLMGIFSSLLHSRKV